MVGMEYQDEMVETECQGDKEKEETLVCRDLLAHKVCILIVSATTVKQYHEIYNQGIENCCDSTEDLAEVMCNISFTSPSAKL